MNNVHLTNGLHFDPGPIDVLILDPPFQMWRDINSIPWTPRNTIAFTNSQNRHDTEHILGRPDIELIWHFPDARFVSHKRPRLSHEFIFIYGPTLNEAYTGEPNHNQPRIRKFASLGSDTIPGKPYIPRERKLLNSVIIEPRVTQKDGRTWAKPIRLTDQVLQWIVNPSDHVFDPFAGTATFGVSAQRIGAKYTGCEINPEMYRIASARMNVLSIPFPKS